MPIKIEKILSIVPGRCRACERCVMYCSFTHNKTHQPSRSRIFVHSHEASMTPVICTQCGLCREACPIYGAMKRDVRTGAITVTDHCDGCGRCVQVCPYGVIFVDELTNKATKCDLCDGDPECAKHCPYDAPIYVEPKKAAMFRRIRTANLIVS